MGLCQFKGSTLGVLPNYVAFLPRNLSSAEHPKLRVHIAGLDWGKTRNQCMN